MKWGVRRKSSAEKPKASDDARAASATQQKIKKGGVKTVSNQELQALVQRKNLEKQYRDLTANDKTSMDRGEAQIKKLLKYSKTLNEVHKFLQTPMGQKVKTGFKVAGMGAKVGAAYATGGTSAAATTAATIAVRRMSNHYTNVG
jgi:hypothetical protein